MAFPTSPVNNQLATVNGINYQYNSTLTAWLIVSNNSAYAMANSAYALANTTQSQLISTISPFLLMGG